MRVPRSRPAALSFILITLLIDVMGAGLVIPVMPELVTQLAPDPQAGARFFGVFLAVYAFAQFVCAPLLGVLSDRYGRRPVLLVSLLGMALDYLLLYFAPNLVWLFVGRLLAGVTAANITAANAYVADISPPEQRARNFGLIGAVFGIGFILGPALGGVLGSYDLRLPFAFAAGLALLNFLYGLLVLPESLPVEKRNRGSLRAANPLSSLVWLSRYPLVRGLTVTFVLINFANQGLFSTWVLFTSSVLNWTPQQNGLGLALVGVMMALVQAGLLGLVVKRVGEPRAVVIGLLIASVQFVALGFARADWFMYLVIVLGSLGGIGGPALQSLVSRAVSEREQGAVQGALASLASLIGIVAPPVMTALFAAATGPRAAIHVPGIVFFVGAALMLLSVFTAVRALRRHLPSAPSGAGTGTRPGASA